MSDAPAVLVIGANPQGLVAATYLARAGARVAVLEAKPVAGGACANSLSVGEFVVPAGPQSLCALDPRVVKELKLARHGLKFAARDLALIGLRSEGNPLVLDRDAHASARAIATASQRDVERFASFHRELFTFGRALRAVWWEEGALREAAQHDEWRRLAVTDAGTFLDAAFESETLKATFAFDAMTGGLSPSDTGSSLLFAWRAAQEMCGLQGAVAIPRGGVAALTDALVSAAQAAGVEIRTNAAVTRLLLSGDAVTGVVLASGEEIAARLVLSSLSPQRTLLQLAPTGAVGFAAAKRSDRAPQVGEAKLVLALKSVPGFATSQPEGRFVIVERLENCIDAHGEARAGRLPAELALEAVVPTLFDSSLTAGDTHLLSVLVRPVPISPAEGWSQFAPRLVDAVLAILERHASGLKESIVAASLVEPNTPEHGPLTARHMLAGWRARIATPIGGLFLCGEAAEPVPAVSCRAARIAAALAEAQLKGVAR